MHPKHNISLYIHWPFCKSKCPYCDFNSHVRNLIDYKAMRDAYITELSYFADILQTRKIQSVFFGGGTPSLAPPSLIADIIDELNKNYSLTDDVEITLEANPTSVESENFFALSQAGINRVSLGIQSLNPNNLRFLGREHSVQEALKAIEIARNQFSRFSLDFIYALPNQTLKEWIIELEQITQLISGHVSLYQLTIEKGTAFYKDFLQKKWTLPEDDMAADFYLATNELLEEKGFIAYEVSNYSKPGQECLHNLNYWKSGDYIGIGAGAHGRYTKHKEKHATQMIHNPEQWLSSVQTNGHALQQHYSLSPNQQLEEKIMMGLRLNEGINTDNISEQKVSFLIEQGLLNLKQNNISTTIKGRLLLNSIIEYLIDEN